MWTDPRMDQLMSVVKLRNALLEGLGVCLKEDIVHVMLPQHQQLFLQISLSVIAKLFL